MSDITFKIDNRKLKEKLALLTSTVKSTEAMTVAQAYMQTLLENHIAFLAVSRHNKLGAPSSNHYDANKVYAGTVTADSAEVIIDIPGINRAYHDITILPKNGKYLTIPVNPIAYGYRVADLRSQGYNIFRPKGKNVLGISGPDNTFVALYALATSVFQPKDPTLLPTDEDLEIAFASGCEDYLKTITALQT